jgi:hypothetical protein
MSLNPADSRSLRLVAVPFHASGLCHTDPFLISKVLSASIVQGLSLEIRPARNIATIVPAAFGPAMSTTNLATEPPHAARP